MKLGQRATSALQVLYFLLAMMCYVLALQLFFVDNNIAAGGFAGIATVINYIAPISIGTVIFLMNIPFVIIAFIVMGKRYAIKTAIGMLVYSLLANLFSWIPAITTDRFAASVFGGVLYALGAVLLLNAKASAGGTDLVARLLLRKFKNLSLGKMFLIVDGFTVLFAIFVYRDIESGVYALTAIAICSYATDRVISGFNVADICYVITEQPPDDMCQAIMEKMKVGVTLTPGVGMYGKTQKNVLMVVVRPREIHKLRQIILDHDPRAFVVVAWANEVMGGGFRYTTDKS